MKPFEPFAQAAEAAGLNYADTAAPGLGRRRTGRGFRYMTVDGRAIRESATLERVRALVIPPAWKSVWISPDPNGHVQAIGYDDRGRRQYLYHARFRQAREAAKYEHLLAFARALPRLRQRVARNMAAPGLGRRKVLATVVNLLETTMVRVGSETYARANGSFGLTTLRARHVQVNGAELRFHFKAKSGKTWRLKVRDRRIAAVVRRCQELPGQHLFQYVDDDGEHQNISSADVNAYLKDASGAAITAKDFRTWGGTILAAVVLAARGPASSPSAAKAALAEAIGQVAASLGNTPAICRQCYIHPGVIDAYQESSLALDIGTAPRNGLRPEEIAVLAFLECREAGQR
ncbi:MAG TPA: DNA topoisomerase IB [Caulobacteraceae bacterium]|jgi:DNA topoisomerase-1